MEISVGHTPDSDDAFMFYAMLTGKIPSRDFTIKHVVGDIEELNKKASNPVLDVTAVSVHACAYIPNYTILRSGGSFGLGYGPIVISKNIITDDELKKSKLAETMEPVPPIVDYYTPANVLVPLIRFTKCILVSKDSKIVGIITASDTLKMME